MATAEELNIKFPVICLSRDNAISPCEDAARLGRCNALAYFKNRYFEDLLIIDADFAQFRVNKAELFPELGPVQRVIARLINRKLRVRLDMEKIATPNADDAKAKISAWFDREPQFWEETAGVAAWKRRVERAPNMHALTKLFS